jgi:hypothetical protein
MGRRGRNALPLRVIGVPFLLEKGDGESVVGKMCQWPRRMLGAIGRSVLLCSN